MMTFREAMAFIGQAKFGDKMSEAELEGFAGVKGDGFFGFIDGKDDICAVMDLMDDGTADIQLFEDGILVGHVTCAAGPLMED